MLPSPPTQAAVPSAFPTRSNHRRAVVHAAMLVIHRYVGLTIATFLLVAGLTGSVLAFYHELDGLANPWHHVEPPSPGSRPLDPFVLRERIADRFPQAGNAVFFKAEAGQALSVWAEVSPGAWREVFVDPYTGAVIGQRTWGDLGEGMVNLFPFIYRLHYQLALGTVGTVLFGIVALLWTLDCFVGLYLTFPPRRTRGTGDGRSWLARWKPSWLMKGGSLFGGIFTFHRASGLWIWPLLFVFAWSGVGFNLGAVFQPVMKIFGTHDLHDALPQLAEPRATPAIAWREAHVRAKAAMAVLAEERGFTIHGEDSLWYEPGHGTYAYRVHSSLDLAERWGGTSVHLDGDTGAVIAFDAPTGQALGSTLSSWFFALHMGTVGGLPYRILVSICGLIVAILSITGTWIWWHRRKLRVRAKSSRRLPAGG